MAPQSRSHSTGLTGLGVEECCSWSHGGPTREGVAVLTRLFPSVAASRPPTQRSTLRGGESTSCLLPEQVGTTSQRPAPKRLFPPSQDRAARSEEGQRGGGDHGQLRGLPGHVCGAPQEAARAFPLRLQLPALPAAPEGRADDGGRGGRRRGEGGWWGQRGHPTESVSSAPARL